MSPVVTENTLGVQQPNLKSKQPQEPRMQAKLFTQKIPFTVHLDNTPVGAKSDH
jgi:hypothetical protein